MTYEYKTEPFDDQRRIFEKTRDMEHFALLWEQGCGKTKPILDTAAYLFEEGKIDGLLVVAPPGVERNWNTDEIPAHLPDRVMAKTGTFVWQSKKSQTKWHQVAFDCFLRRNGFIIFCISYDGFMSAMGKKAAWRFLKRRRTMYVLDESDDIKTPKAKRTRSVLASGKYADYRRIMTGTPADKPFDLYSQLKFLDPEIWRSRNMASFAAFKHYYGVWFTAAEARLELGYDPGYDKLLGYKNLEELTEILLSRSDRLLKEDILDLPPKLYTKIHFDMTPKQQKFYDQMVKEYEIELADGRLVDGNLAITRLLRLQQITCGYMVTDAEEPVEYCDKTNPRLDVSLAWLERLNHPAIVWCRFRQDINQLMDALGSRAVRYDGLLDEDECERSKLVFNAGDAEFFVANTAKGARGLTLNAAKSTLWYSNSFKLRDRLQGEDRNHRYGQDGADQGEHGFGVLNGDVMAYGSVDFKITASLRGKFDIAAKLTGDRLRDWI